MKEAFLITSAIIVVVYIVFNICINARKLSQTKLGLSMMHFGTGAIIVLVSNMVIAGSVSMTEAEIGYMIYFIAMDWMLYFFMFYCQIYTESHGRIVNPLFGVLCFIDVARLLINHWTHWDFSLVKVKVNGEYFYEFTHGGVYLVHLMICYMMLLSAIIYLVVAAVKSAKLYRQKYINVIIALVLMTAFNGVYLLFELPIDWSVISYTVVLFWIYYLFAILNKSNLINDAKSYMSDHMDNGIVLLDNKYEVVYANEFAQKYFDMKEEEFSFQKGLVADWCKGRDIRTAGDFEEPHKITRDDKKYYYSLKYNKLLDGKNRLNGSYFLIQDITDLREKAREDFYRATRDELTGIYNKNYFYQQAELTLEKSDEPYMLVVSDISNFKLINELFGRETADKILQEHGRRLQQYTKEGDIFGRLDNDHFVLFTPKSHYSEEMTLIAMSQIMQVVNQLTKAEFYCYLGCYETKDKTTPIQVMCDRAIMAGNSIKGTFTSHAAYYTEEMGQRLVDEHELSNELSDAILKGQVQMYLQPQYNDKKEILGGEALVRWIHPERGIVLPGKFLEFFERNGRITEIDKFIWRKACQQLRDWQEEGRTNLYISVNISPRDLMLMDVYKEITNLVKEYNIPPSSLRLEITETAVMNNLQDTIKTLDKFRSEGFIIEMDDFGSGYSSFNMLKDINFDVLKIDMLFLSKTDNIEKSKTILKSIVDMAEAINLDVICEGVETEDQLAYLQKIGCNTYQGYLFAKPMPVESFLNLL